MRESIGGAWLLGIVMTFIVLFASFLAISVNYSKAFKVKNNVVDLIEKNEGMTHNTVKDIYGYLQTEGYILKGNCQALNSDEEESGDTSKNYIGFDKDDKALDQTKALYCVKKTSASTPDTALSKDYYSVAVFFRLDLPVFGDIFTFKVTGETMSIYFSKDEFSM